MIAGSARGAVLRLRCRPGRPRTAAAGIHDGALRLDVAAPPEKGKANDEVLAWLARALALPRSALVLTAGAASREKSVLVSGLSADEIRRRLAAAE